MSRKVVLIIIHCSDSDIRSHDNIETVRAWHHERGFSDIGYHYFISKDGSVHRGRPEEEVGAHVKGHNSRSIGICLSGRREFSRKQFESLERLCLELTQKYDLEKKDIVPHNSLDPNKTCPNFDLQKLVSSWGWH